MSRPLTTSRWGYVSRLNYGLFTCHRSKPMWYDDDVSIKLARLQRRQCPRSRVAKVDELCRRHVPDAYRCPRDSWAAYLTMISWRWRGVRREWWLPPAASGPRARHSATIVMIIIIIVVNIIASTISSSKNNMQDFRQRCQTLLLLLLL